MFFNIRILNITKIVIWTFGILIATRQIKALQDLALVLFSSSGVVVVVLGLSAQETMKSLLLISDMRLSLTECARTSLSQVTLIASQLRKSSP